MSLRRLLPILFLATVAASGQSGLPPESQPKPILRSSTSLVLVPTLVRSASGELIHTLKPSDFRLLDNGVSQSLSLEQVERQPISLLVLMQTGASASRQFEYYAGVPTMLETLMGSSPYQAALVTFDSQPENLWPFYPDIAGLKDAFTKTTAGDSGAAVYDALNLGIDLLERQPPTSQRILLLLSQAVDDGSKLREQDILTRLGQSDILVYSFTFSPDKTWLKDQFTKPRQENPPYQFAPDQPPALHTFNLSTPLSVALHAMRANAAAQLASLSGGESFPFNNRHDLEQQLAVLANHIANRYLLSFRPGHPSSGLHHLALSIPSDPTLQISARSSYWVSTAGPRTENP